MLLHALRVLPVLPDLLLGEFGPLLLEDALRDGQTEAGALLLSLEGFRITLPLGIFAELDLALGVGIGDVEPLVAQAFDPLPLPLDIVGQLAGTALGGRSAALTVRRRGDLVPAVSAACDECRTAPMKDL
ncbi:hypothetical protein [Streptomyces sp. NPDC059970]|uniref:hypothetical protein n=1 Tax=Streptomyces sp. NPDC059970 TaxID=3347019 RepID=UPI0036B599CA